MKKVLILGTFILSAISFAKTTTEAVGTPNITTKATIAKTAAPNTNINNIKTTLPVHGRDSQVEDWWMTDRQRDRGRDRK